MIKMKSNRKKIIFPLSFLLLFSLIFPLSVAQDEVEEMSIIPEKDTVYTDQIFNVSIYINSSTPINFATASITFNTSLMEALSVENGGVFDMWMDDLFPGFIEIDNVNGTIKKISAFSSPPASPVSGVFAIIKFRAKNTSGIGVIDFIEDVNLTCFGTGQLTEIEKWLPSSLIPASVLVNPVDIKVEVSSSLVGNETFFANITIDPHGQTMAGASCILNFNPDVINVDSFEYGTLFSNNVGSATSVDNENGTIGPIIAWDLDGVSEAGLLVSIVFQPLQTGFSYLNLTDIEIKDMNNSDMAVVPMNSYVEVDLTPPEVNITALYPSVNRNNITYVATPLTINATVIEDHLAEAMLIIADNETKQFFYGKSYDYENYTGTPPSYYSEIWEYVYNLTNGTTWEEYITVWESTWNETTFFVLSGLFNETGGTPNVPAYAIFYDNLTLMMIYTEMGPANITYGVSTYLVQNMISSQAGPPLLVNTSTIFVITEDFRLVPTLPLEKEYAIIFRAVDAVGNENTGWKVATLDNTPPISSIATGTPAYGYYIKTTTPIYINSTDNGVGLGEIHYRIDGGAEQIIPGTTSVMLTMGEEGEHTIEYWAIDYLGNEEIHHNQTYYVDDTPPEITKTVGEPKYGDYIKSTTLFNLTATDTSGLQSLQYRIWYNGWSNWTEYDGNFTLEGEGKHYLEVKAIDNLGNTAEDNQTYYVDDTPPYTSINLQGTYEDGKYTTDVTVVLTASDSLSGVYSIIYSVDGGSSITALGSYVSFSVSSEGEHTIKYRAVDNLGKEENTKTKTFTIQKNKPPTADFTYTPEEPTDVEDIKFDASLSNDPEGNIENYTWDFGDGTIKYGKVVYHRYEDNGQYTVKLSVKDNKGATDSVSKQIIVKNDPPKAMFTHFPDKPKIGEEVQFNSSLSSDEDGNIVSWQWDFGDGNTSTEQNPTHVYLEEGTYNVTLTVTDDDGDTHTTIGKVEVIKEEVNIWLYLTIIVVLVIIAGAVVAIWRRRTKS